MATLEATPRAPLQIKRPTRRYSQGAYAFVALGTAERHYPTTRRCAIFRKRMEFQKKKKTPPQILSIDGLQWRAQN